MPPAPGPTRHNIEGLPGSAWVLAHRSLAERLGIAAHARVLAEFLGDRHLEQYVDLFSFGVGDPGL